MKYFVMMHSHDELTGNYDKVEYVKVDGHELLFELWLHERFGPPIEIQYGPCIKWKYKQSTEHDWLSVVRPYTHIDLTPQRVHVKLWHQNGRLRFNEVSRRPKSVEHKEPYEDMTREEAIEEVKRLNKLMDKKGVVDPDRKEPY